jgi:hypothetical protein
MTVSSSTNRVSYNGNGSTTVFAYTFKAFDQDDLTVIIRSADGTETVKTITTDYTVSGIGEDGGGNVTFGTAPATGQTVVILREQPFVQELDLVPNDPFPAEVLEGALDKLTFMVQQHEEVLGRTIKASRTNVIAGAEFTISAADRANKVFAFDNAGDLSIAQELGTYRGNWAASTAFAERDIVKDTSTNNIYICLVAHTSTGSQPITSNADVAKWALLVDAESATNSADAAASSAAEAEADRILAQAAKTDAETAQTAAELAETNAETAETNAEAAQTAAEAAQAAAELVYDNFDDRYLGAKATDPTVDNDGDALIDGALYFDTANNVMKVYDLGTTTWLRTTPTSGDQANINAVTANATNINTVAAIDTDVTAVANVSANVTTVAGISANVTTVAGISANVTTVAGISSDVTTVSGFVGEINTVADDLTAGSFVAGSEYDFGLITDPTSGTSGSPDGFIVTVFNNLGDITAVANIDSDVTAVAGIAANVTTVAGISADVSVVAANVADVTNFSDVYYGPSATAPTLRQDGSALQEGDLYFSTASDLINVWDGAQWQAAVASLSGALVAANNLSDLTNTATARTSLGLGTAATSDTGDFAAASHTHTLSDVTDAGTMAAQDADDVNITGGVIDGGSIV